MAPGRLPLAPDLDIGPVITGLWQVADMERDGRTLDPDAAAAALLDYVRDGFDTFDMADHYGSAEIICGRFGERAASGAFVLPEGAKPAMFTKWCPEPGPMTADVVRAGIAQRLTRLSTDRLDLLQFHWWMYEHPGYIDALAEMTALKRDGLIGHLGLTNFNTDHVHLTVRHGIEIATNQVCFSLLDRRAAGDMTALCLDTGVRLLAYGTLGGGFLTDRWVGAAEPGAGAIGDWSKMKYRRFLGEIGGWDALQALLGAVKRVADRHRVSVANVATRWVLEQPAVAAVIVGARLGEREHRADNARIAALALEPRDHDEIAAALEGVKPIPGDCGDEYRRPPFLTASGDLSHHLAGFPKVYAAAEMPGRPGRLRIDTGSAFEAVAGYSRAVRVADRILVSGTTATHGAGETVCPGDVRGQTVYILDKIAASIQALGGTLDDVVRTRIYLKDQARWEAASGVHGRYLGHVRPANTLVEISDLVGDYEVEIEAEAVVGL
jgi:aryl-alcohol dehydrogenase-like predicted oxidoreductase/enamine deaminase RidA (YjgF/YER057c/UK114 family)